MTKGIVVFVAGMYAAEELVCITAARGSDAQVAIVVATSHHAGLVGYAYAPCAVVVPERIGADMTTAFAVIPFQVAVHEVFPRIVVFGLMFGLACNDTRPDTILPLWGALPLMKKQARVFIQKSLFVFEKV